MFCVGAVGGREEGEEGAELTVAQSGMESPSRPVASLGEKKNKREQITTLLQLEIPLYGNVIAKVLGSLVSVSLQLVIIYITYFNLRVACP